MFLNPNTLTPDADLASSRSIINILHDPSPIGHSLLYPSKQSRRVVTQFEKKLSSEQEISSPVKIRNLPETNLMQIIAKPWSERSAEVTPFP
jgi:hypothetical protein